MARKRGNHEGTIYKRRDGRWCATIDAGWRNGRRRRKSFYGKTRGDVANKLTKALNDQQSGLPIAADRETVGAFLRRWLQDCARVNVRPKTFTSYSDLIRLHLSPTLGNRPLEKLAPQDIQAFITEKLGTGLAPRTVQYAYAILRAAMNQAVRWNLVPRNVVTLVSPPRVPRKEIMPFNPEEARAFLAAAQGHRLEALFAVAVAIGLREGEALGLRWQDIDVKDGILSVRSAVQRIKGKLHLVEVKTERSRRTIALPQVALDAFIGHRQRQEQERMLAGDRWQEKGLVFTTNVGTPIDPRNALREFHALLKVAKIPRRSFHSLRHACATLLLAQGVNPRTVMEILGHSSIRVTLDIYSHVIPMVHREAMNRMDTILGRTSVANSATASKPN